MATKAPGDKYEKVEITSLEMWNQWIAKSNNMLLVVDIHKSWCGPCTVLEPLFNKLGVNVEKFSQRVMIMLVRDNCKARTPPPLTA